MLQFLIVSLQSQDCFGFSDLDTAIVLIHGFGESAEIMSSMYNLIQKDFPDRLVVNLEILLGAISSIFESPERYGRAAATKIQQLTQGYKCIDIISHSQGSFVARQYIQFFASSQDVYPNVRSFVSLAGVLNGMYCKSNCPTGLMNVLDPLINQKSKSQLLVPSGYWRTDFTPNILCKLNGGCGANQSTINAFQGLKTFGMLFSDHDDILVPKQTGHFGYIVNGVEFEAEALAEYGVLRLNTLKTQGVVQKHKFDGFKHNDFVRDKVGITWACVKGMVANVAKNCPI
ncbi:Palmitoyl-protein_thioesterase [Hexamita inflata]|uniref:Palmitoyl-protein thioesterase n=1 Tax=Hexamita inflata TaxID=28002 RepID=A0AA86UTT8_9EUKA|nr:Palmitoyl-protein thioesterase [Hexamita inflata]